MDRISRKIEFRLTRCIKFWRNEITSGDVHREKKEITFFTGCLIFITIDIIESFLPINQDKIPLARPKINRMYIYIYLKNEMKIGGMARQHRKNICKLLVSLPILFFNFFPCNNNFTGNPREEVDVSATHRPDLYFSRRYGGKIASIHREAAR